MSYNDKCTHPMKCNQICDKAANKAYSCQEKENASSASLEKGSKEEDQASTCFPETCLGSFHSLHKLELVFRI